MRLISKRNWFLSGRSIRFVLFTIISFDRDKCSLLIRCLVMCCSGGVGLFAVVLVFGSEVVSMGLLNPIVNFVVSVLTTFRSLIVVGFCDVDFGAHVMTFCLEFGPMGLTERWKLLL